MTHRSDWQVFFDAHAPRYMQNCFVRNIATALKPGAKLVLTALNACRMIRAHTPEDIAQGWFDPLTLTEFWAMAPAEGQPEIPTRERGFVATELRLMAQCAGLEVVQLWGGTAGAWNRGPLDLDEFEIMLVARRPKSCVA